MLQNIIKKKILSNSYIIKNKQIKIQIIISKSINYQRNNLICFKK